MSIQTFGAMNVGPSRSVGATRDRTHGRVAIQVLRYRQKSMEGRRDGGRGQLVAPRDVVV